MDFDRPEESAESSSGKRPSRPGSSVTRITRPVASPAPSSDQVRLVGANSPPHEQKTVISKRNPASSAPRLLMRPSGPFEIGKILEGEQLGHYELEEFIGGGGMGAVFRALDTELGRTVAVKVVASDDTDDDTLRRFKNEAQSAARLDHPNIARVYYVGQDKGWNYIVFEYIEGVNLRDLVVHKGPLALDEAISYTLQAAEALSHAFQRDVVHRDIKPSNLLVMPDGHVKLVDMGLARLHQVQSAQNDLTATGVTLGTFDYISPEQARDPRKSDVRSDLYSLGCTLYFMLTGLPPFPEGTVLQKLLNHNSEAPPDPRQFRPDLPEDLSQILNKLLAKRPMDRFQEPKDLTERLLRFAHTHGLPSASRGGNLLPATDAARWSAWERLIPTVVPVAALFAIVFGMEWYSRLDAHVSLPALQFAEPAPRVAPPEKSPPRKTPDGTQSVESPVAPPASPPTTPTATPSNEPGNNRPEPDRPSNGPGSTSPTPREERPESPTGNGNSPPPTAPATEPVKVETVKTLVVGASDDVVPPGTEIVPSLAAAVVRLAKQPSIETLELRVSGELLTDSLVLPPRNLTVRAGEGFRPVIVFRPRKDDLSTTTAMLELAGAECIWQDVDLRLEVPAARPGGWSLFRLDQVQKFDLRRCTLTIHNEADKSDQVVFFELVPPHGPKSTVSPPVVKLTSCVARGQATLVAAREVFPLRVQWDQGLATLTGRLLETGGAMVKPKWKEGRVDVILQNVTARLDRGMCLMDANPSAPYQIGLVTNCSMSNIWTQESPLIELRGVEESMPVKSRLNMNGRANFYPTTYLRVVSPSGIEEFDGGQAELKDWYDGKRDQPSAMILWTGDPFVGPVDRHTKLDFLLQKSESNPAWKTAENMGPSGFDPALLPDPVETPPPTP